MSDADDYHDLPPELMTYYKLTQAAMYLAKHGHHGFSATVTRVAADYYAEVCD